MPLVQSASKETLSENIASEVNAGKKPDQAEAIAYNVQRANDDAEGLCQQAQPGLTLAKLNDCNRAFWEGK